MSDERETDELRPFTVILLGRTDDEPDDRWMGTVRARDRDHAIAPAQVECVVSRDGGGEECLNDDELDRALDDLEVVAVIEGEVRDIKGDWWMDKRRRRELRDEAVAGALAEMEAKGAPPA